MSACLRWLPERVTTRAFVQLDANDPALARCRFGGLAGYHSACNDAISTPFAPPRTHCRSDTVDPQRGQAQWRGGNRYDDPWDDGFIATLL